MKTTIVERTYPDGRVRFVIRKQLLGGWVGDIDVYSASTLERAIEILPYLDDSKPVDRQVWPVDTN